MISKNKKMKILFLGYAIPDKMFDDITKKERYPQIQGMKLIWNIVRGIEENSSCAIDLISAAPVSNYPTYPGIFFGFSRWKHNDDANDVIIPFINIIILKHVTRFVSSLALVILWLLKNRKVKNRQILIYAMHSPFVLAALSATKLFGGKTKLIIPDMPAFMDFGIYKSFVRKVAKPIDSFLLIKMIKKMTGLIVLSRHLVEDFVPITIPYLVIEGMVSCDPLRESTIQKLQHSMKETDQKIIMYAGALTGLNLLFEAFALINNSNFRLWICGRGEMEQSVRTATLHDVRIIYWGIVSNEKLWQLQLQATVLVDVRPSKTPFIRYSFPSKLLEYMVMGRPVISTALPGIPDDYKDYLYFLENETPQELASLIQQVCSKSPKELSEFGQRAKVFVENEKSYLRHGKRLYEFMTQN